MQEQMALLAAKVEALDGAVRKQSAGLESVGITAGATAEADILTDEVAAALFAKVLTLENTAEQHGEWLESMRDDFEVIDEAVSTVAMLQEGASEMQEVVEGLQEQVEAQSASVEALEEAAGKKAEEEVVVVAELDVGSTEEVISDKEDVSAIQVLAAKVQALEGVVQEQGAGLAIVSEDFNSIEETLSTVTLVCCKLACVLNT